MQQVEQAVDLTKDSWQRDYPRPQAIDDDGELFQAEIIGDRTLWNGTKKYKMHWIGYPSSEDQWLRQVDVTDDLVKEYEMRQKNRRQTTTMAVIDSRTIAEALISTGLYDTVKSLNDTPFSYEIRLLREGQGKERPVLYILRNTKDFEKNYESTERELACVA